MRLKPWFGSDGLGERLEPLLPRRQRRFRYPGRKPHPGRTPLDDRLVLQGILFVLHPGIGWEHLPQELGFGCGPTAWRRLRDWQEVGVCDRLHSALLSELHAAGEIDWSRAIVDSGTTSRSCSRCSIGCHPRAAAPGGRDGAPTALSLTAATTTTSTGDSSGNEASNR